MPRDLSKGYAPKWRDDYDVIRANMSNRRASIAADMLMALEAMSRRENGGLVTISDSALGEAAFGASPDDVAKVRKRLVSLEILEQVEAGRKGRAQTIRLTCYRDAETLREAAGKRQKTAGKEQENGRETAEKSDPGASVGAPPDPDAAGKRQKTAGKEQENGRKRLAYKNGNGNGNGNLFPEDGVSSCSTCTLPTPECFCPRWDAYRNSLKRWGSPAGSKAEALAKVARLKKPDRIALGGHLDALCAHLDAHNPATCQFFGLKHLKTLINRPHTWGELPEPTRQAAQGDRDEWGW
jgi:hypothetical protein